MTNEKDKNEKRIKAKTQRKDFIDHFNERQLVLGINKRNPFVRFTSLKRQFH